MNQMPLDSDFIQPKEKRPFWQQVLIFIIASIIIVFAILIINNLIEIFHLVSQEDSLYRALSD